MKQSNHTLKKKVLVAMSGGVDSSVAALLMKEAGYDVAGVTMSLGVQKKQSSLGTRFTDEAIADAEKVCDQLKIPHRVFPFADLMEQKVIGKFISEYLNGRTPNPCVDCNHHLKFGALLEKARAMGFDYLATGHFARIEKTNHEYRLMRPSDKIKDQSYFLYPIRVQDLPFIIFPLGQMTKDEVRKKAKDYGLQTAYRAESQDICFVPDGDYGQVFQDRGVKSAPGDIVDRQGRILGRHRGLIHYTIGQRGGLGISAKAPLYVIEMDVKTNRLTVGGKDDVLSWELIAGDLNCLVDSFPIKVEAKIRYRKKPALCTLTYQGDKLHVVFDEAQEAITPGQSLVLYDGDVVLGGGIIETVLHRT